MVLVKNLKVCERFVLCKLQPKKVFGDVLVRKQVFLDNINMDSKRSQNWHFLSMILVKKLTFFHLLFLSKIDPGKVFGDVLEKIEAFKDCKNNCVGKTQNQNVLVKNLRFLQL